MLRMLMFFAAAAAAASQIPYLLGLTTLATTDTPKVEATTQGMHSATLPQRSPAASGTVVLASDGRGHFTATFQLNGKPVQGLVDTGASSIAINETTARRLGFTANALDFRHVAQTANGETKIAEVMLDRIEISGIRVKNVPAVVLRDSSLSGTLIGMSFLKRLSSFKVQDGELYLTQ